MAAPCLAPTGPAARPLLATRRPCATARAAAVGAPAHPITLVASDVDGTMLDSQQRLSQRVIDAVAACEGAGVPLVIATGKAPAAPWTTSVLPALGPPRPGVYMQGLVLLDAAGRTLYSRPLDPATVDAVQAWAAEPGRGHTLAAYCLPGGRGGPGAANPGTGPAAILATADDAAARRLTFYGEPPPAAVPGSLAAAAAARGLDIYKLIALGDPGGPLDDPATWDAARKALDGLVTLTAALPGMMEALPPGASKGEGLLRLTGELEVPPYQCMFVGDGANDADALLLAGWGVAVANACEEARVCADVVLEESNDQGGLAVAIDRWVLGPRGLL